MERSVWTDERLDDVIVKHDSQFELLRSEIRDVRIDLTSEIRDLRVEVRDELSKLHRDMLHLTIAMIGAFAALFAALVAQSL